MKRTKAIVVALEGADIFRGPLVLVNRAHPLKEAPPEPDLVRVGAGVWLEMQTARLYEAVMRETGAAGQIVPVSGYRSREEQRRLYGEALAQRGAEYTNTYVAKPGCSEHETGLALDVGKAAADIDFITPDFPYTGICGQFRLAAARHGFIQRYPEGKEAITGIGHEPWHFRYVGVPHSAVMGELGFTLEEYVQWIKAFPWESRPYRCETGGRAFAVGYVPAQEGETEISLPGEPYTISGNNVDGFIAAVWECAP